MSSDSGRTFYTVCRADFFQRIKIGDNSDNCSRRAYGNVFAIFKVRIHLFLFVNEYTCRPSPRDVFVT